MLGIGDIQLSRNGRGGRTWDWQAQCPLEGPHLFSLSTLSWLCECCARLLLQLLVRLSVCYPAVRTYILIFSQFLTPGTFPYPVWCVAESCHFIQSTLIYYFLFIYLAPATVSNASFACHLLQFVRPAFLSVENTQFLPLLFVSFPEIKCPFLFHTFDAHTDILTLPWSILESINTVSE